MTPEVTYEFYNDSHKGSMDEEAFDSALPEARARLVALTGTDIPQRAEVAWCHGLCALADKVGGEDMAGHGLTTYRVDSVSVSMTEGAASATDADCVAPWLHGTGMLYQGMGRVIR